MKNWINLKNVWLHMVQVWDGKKLKTYVNLAETKKKLDTPSKGEK